MATAMEVECFETVKEEGMSVEDRSEESKEEHWFSDGIRFGWIRSEESEEWEEESSEESEESEEESEEAWTRREISDKTLLAMRIDYFNQCLTPKGLVVMRKLVKKRDWKIRAMLKEYRDRYRRLAYPDDASYNRAAASLSELNEVRCGGSVVDKGYFAGNIVLKVGRRIVDYAHVRRGTPVPYEVGSMKLIGDWDDYVYFILIVPDETCLTGMARLLVHVRFRCVIIAPANRDPDSPDLPTRLFLKKLHLELKVPVLALGHSHPAWVKTLCIYADRGLPTDPPHLDLTIPDIKWLGLRPTSFDDAQLPVGPKFRFCLRPDDLNIALDLLKDDYILNKNQDGWVHELKRMENTMVETDFSCFEKYGDISAVLVDIYLPFKLPQFCKISTTDCLPSMLQLQCNISTEF